MRDYITCTFVDATREGLIVSKPTVDRIFRGRESGLADGGPPF